MSFAISLIPLSNNACKNICNRRPRATRRPRPTNPNPRRLDTARLPAEDSKVLARQMSAEIGKKQSEARRLREKKPRQALKLLQDARQEVTDSKLSEEYRTQLLRRIDITLDETEKYVNDHRAEIDLDKKNEAVLAERRSRQRGEAQVQQKIAEMVEEFNRLNHEQRFAEMEIVARRLNEIAPEDPVAKQVWQNAKFIRREMMNRDRRIAKRKATVWEQLNAVEEVGRSNPSPPTVTSWSTTRRIGKTSSQDRKGSKDRNAAPHRA